MLNVHTKAQSILTCPLFCDLIFTIYFILFTANPNMNNLYIYIERESTRTQKIKKRVNKTTQVKQVINIKLTIPI
jgi:hypothetical protein